MKKPLLKITKSRAVIMAATTLALCGFVHYSSYAAETNDDHPAYLDQKVSPIELHGKWTSEIDTMGLPELKLNLGGFQMVNFFIVMRSQSEPVSAIVEFDMSKIPCRDKEISLLFVDNSNITLNDNNDDVECKKTFRSFMTSEYEAKKLSHIIKDKGLMPYGIAYDGGQYSLPSGLSGSDYSLFVKAIHPYQGMGPDPD